MYDPCKPHINHQNITPYIQLGVIKIQCCATKRSLFSEYRNMLVGVQDFKQNLEESTCLYPKIIADDKEYGLDVFEYSILASENLFFDDNFRKQELLKHKEAWSGYLYIK
uniref:Uncharacterized protein n=1 Tax=Chlorella vulgaris TaxID=3077 RepID=V9H0S2_CHLVU|nr:hypothetical protein ChvulCp083 [Chlorella vulgaris]pir/T07270/ hypothetical protein 109 - Chlorella vulgaris chloroplast [Chlorella vulgaris]BAA57918.1 unnamed protein product [Chlorella vulgaris]